MTTLELILCVIDNTMISIELPFKELSYYHKLFTDLGFTVGKCESDNTLVYQFFRKNSETYCLWYYLNNSNYCVFQKYEGAF
jgi:predicted lactoylglutathione lyase